MSEPAFPTPQVLTLEGGHNFREVGGYPTMFGASLRRGMIWRSAGVNRLSAADCRTIRSLGIRTIADLRTDHERRLFPTPTDLSDGLDVLTWSSDFGADAERAGSAQTLADLDHVALRGAIARLYTHIAESHARPFGDVYRAIAAGAAPILIHCTAGKDRTGMAVAILLELLGVPREWTLWDYEQTNARLDKTKVDLESAAGVGGTAEWLARLSPEGRDLLLAADALYLTAALDGIEGRYGSVAAFAMEALGLSREELKALCKRLLESGEGR